MHCIIFYIAGCGMEIQLKKGILEICVLYALSKGESYGYKIISDLQGIVEISESTLYPILRRLETGGYVTTRAAEHNGRLRRYYKITAMGYDKFYAGKADLLEINGIFTKIYGGRL